MLRVLKPGGRIVFSRWPPEHFIGRMFALVGKYVPPPPGVSPSPEWGDPNIVRSRLGDAVVDLTFQRGIVWFSALGVQHYRVSIEATSGASPQAGGVTDRERTPATKPWRPL
jgi:hypothetical protein